MEDYYTDPKFVKGLYKLIYDVHNVFVGNDIFYYVDGGTLLGAMPQRGSGVIPWDDDIDLEVSYKDISKITSTSVRKQFDILGYKVRKHSEGWVKIVKKGRGHQPDADVFPVRVKKEGGKYRTAWDFEVGRDAWPKCYFYINELLPLKKYKFGKIFVLGPKNPRPMLNRCYGPSWAKKGYITQDKDHMPLDEPILVQKGQFHAARDFYVPTKPQVQPSRSYLSGGGFDRFSEWGGRRSPAKASRRRRKTPRRSRKRSPRRKSRSPRKKSPKKCPRGKVLSPKNRCIIRGGSAYKKYFD